MMVADGLHFHKKEQLAPLCIGSKIKPVETYQKLLSTYKSTCWRGKKREKKTGLSSEGRADSEHFNGQALVCFQPISLH